MVQAEKFTYEQLEEEIPTSYLQKQWGFIEAKERHYKTGFDERYTDIILCYYTWISHDNMPWPCRCCRFCKLSFPTMEKNWKHHRTYECKLNRAMINGTKLPENPLICKVCNYTAPNEKKMNFHKTTYEHKLGVAVANNEPLPVNEQFCKACCYQFKSVPAYKYHLGTEKHKKKVLEMTFTCEPCNKKFKCKQNLQLHLKSQKHLRNIGQSTKTLNTYCEVCDKQYKNVAEVASASICNVLLNNYLDVESLELV